MGGDDGEGMMVGDDGGAHPSRAFCNEHGSTGGFCRTLSTAAASVFLAAASRELHTFKRLTRMLIMLVCVCTAEAKPAGVSSD